MYLVKVQLPCKLARFQQSVSKIDDNKMTVIYPFRKKKSSLCNLTSTIFLFILFLSMSMISSLCLPIQKFFHAVSHILDADNREKWEDAQQVGNGDAVALNCRSALSAYGVGGLFVCKCDNHEIICTYYKNVVNVITRMQSFTCYGARNCVHTWALLVRKQTTDVTSCSQLKVHLIKGQKMTLVWELYK